jgi:hypothetical protein
MVSIVNNTMVNYRGLSTDTKPVSAANGSTFLEMDTGTIYFYDEDSSDWISASGGSSVVGTAIVGTATAG